MATKAFLESQDYLQFKEILNDSIILKSVDVKTEGKSNEQIAREVTAHEIAVKIIMKAMRRFERQGLKEMEKQSWK